MTLPATTDIKVLIGGQAWNAIDGTTTTIVTSLITRAAEDISDITGTTTRYSGEIAYRASELALNNILGGMGPETVADKDLTAQRTFCGDEWKRKLLQKGFSAKGERISILLSDD